MDWERVFKAIVIYTLWTIAAALAIAGFYLRLRYDLSLHARLACVILCPVISFAAFLTGFEILRCEVTR
jgi:hypothetical protein